MTQDANASPLLEVRNLRTHFPVVGGLLRRPVAWVKAVDDISFSIRKGETLGLVGESGCGKTTLGRSIVRLNQPQSGQILFEGTDVAPLRGARLKRVRREVQMIFQDPYGSLNPRMKVGDLIAEGLQVQGGVGRADRMRQAADLAELVGLRREHLRRYAHEFSGGQRQRIGIARALALKPSWSSPTSRCRRSTCRSSPRC